MSPRKLARLAALARFSKISVCADDPRGIDLIEAAARDAGVRLTVLLELDVGAGRCGVAPGPGAVALGRRIADSAHLRFGGLQAYHGSAQHQRSAEERSASIAHAARKTEGVVRI